MSLVSLMRLNLRVDMFAKIITQTTCTNYMYCNVDLEDAMLKSMDLLCDLRLKQRTLYIVGNGGSASIASHALVDFVNVAKINAHVLHESSLVTCMANDFGYENVYSRILSQIMQPQDLLIAISSSGNSKNICNAAKIAKEKGNHVITFTGFDASNSLRSLGDINFWLDSNDYGFVEVGHQFILHNLADRFGLENKMSSCESIENSLHVAIE